MNIREALIEVQFKLKAPKSKFNKFGNYAYRSLEDILEAAKPLLHEYKLTLILEDDVALIGDRFYVIATATLTDLNGDKITTKAMARECKEKLNKQGVPCMDESQITGSSSTYARKYALNALFLIDDTKDADTEEYTKQTTDQATLIKAEIFNLVKQGKLTNNDVTMLIQQLFNKAKYSELTLDEAKKLKAEVLKYGSNQG